MVKILRKYNKWFLVVGGSLLMIAWLIGGTAGQFQPDPGKRVIATVHKNTKVTIRDMAEADAQFRVLSDMIPFAMNARQPMGLGVENGTHWFLLAKEAEEAGFTGEPSDGAEFIPEMARIEAQLRVLAEFGEFGQRLLSDPRFMDERVNTTIDRISRVRAVGDRALGETGADGALARLRGVRRLIDAYQRGGRMSDIMLAVEAGNVLTRVSVDAVVVSPDRIAAGSDEPSEEALAALFEKYKNNPPGEGEFGFGYLLPPRVKMEWMRISRDAVRGAIVLDPVEVSKHWQQNRAEFPGEYTEARAAVEAKLRDAKTTTAISEADRAFKAFVRSATRRLPSEGPVKKLPADWQQIRPTMDAAAAYVAEEVQRTQKFRFPLPAVQIRGAMYTPIRSLATDADFSGFQARAAGRGVGIDALANDLQELSSASALGVQVGVPFENPLENAAGDLIYVTFTSAREASAPESIDEVRAEVVRDARRLAAFELLKLEAVDYQLTALSEGLEALAATLGTEGDRPAVQNRILMTRRVTDRSAQLDDQALRDAVFDRVDAIGVRSLPGDENLPLRVLTVPLPRYQGVAVLKITGWRPLSMEDMRTLTDSDVGFLYQRELTDALGGDAASMAFSPPAIRARLNYKSIGEGGEELPEDAPIGTPISTPASGA
jgi:hypothetical protein